MPDTVQGKEMIWVNELLSDSVHPLPEGDKNAERLPSVHLLGWNAQYS